ncbi:MAG: nucleoside recognition domain-containing protein [Acutalibacteraceae bacterium]
MKKKCGTALFYIGVMFMCIAILCFARQTAEGVKKALICTVEILIPALFPFMVLSVLMIRSGFAQICGRVLSPITKSLFGLGGAAAPVIFLSLIGGFPVGAKGIRTLYNQGLIDKTTARRMGVFCISSGPAFLITAVGVRMLNSPQIGVILFVSQTTAVIILGVLARLIPIEKNIKTQEQTTEPFGDAVVCSAYDAANSMIQMMALVIVFFVVLEILSALGVMEFLKGLPFLPQTISQNIPKILLEVSAACSGLSSSGGVSPIAFAFAVGWGGLCVHFQIFGILGEIAPPKPLFFLFRLLNAVLSASITAVLLRIFQPVQNVFSNYTGVVSYANATHISGSIALLITCVLFVLTLKIPAKRKN